MIRDGTPHGTDPLTRMRRVGWETHRRVYGLGKPLTPKKKPIPPRRPPTLWKDRDDFVRTCVPLGLTTTQIARVTRHSPQPFHGHSDVYRKIDSLRAMSLYRRRAPRRADPHNKLIVHGFIGIADAAFRRGLDLSDIARDSSPDGETFRPDCTVQAGRYLYFLEPQKSKFQPARWRERMLRYLAYYRKTGKRFTVLFPFVRGSLPTLLETARDVLSEHPSLNLFLFCRAKDYLSCDDIVGSPIWHAPWSRNPVKLM